jgi:hypothetical protein
MSELELSLAQQRAAREAGDDEALAGASQRRVRALLEVDPGLVNGETVVRVPCVRLIAIAYTRKITAEPWPRESDFEFAEPPKRVRIVKNKPRSRRG